MSQDRSLETLVGEICAAEPSESERAAIWRSVVEQLTEDQAAHGTPSLKLSRRWLQARSEVRVARLAALAAGAIALALAVIALLPTGDRSGGSKATASAAEVLNATAMSAGSLLPEVKPGEYAYARVRHSGEGAKTAHTESWEAIDGSARIVAREGSSEIYTETYRAGSTRGLVIEDGVERPMPPPQLAPNSRYVVSRDEVVRLPTNRRALLASLRAGAERAARLYARPRPKGYFPRVDRTYELAGRDLLVVETATSLLVGAPLSPRQRAAMLSLLADAPHWYRPGASTKPIEIRNLGRTEDALGRSGIALRFTIELNQEEAGRDERLGAMQGTFDLVLDPQRGRVLEDRSYEHGLNKEPEAATVEEQRVVDSIKG